MGTSISVEKFFGGNEYWDTSTAIDEIKVYCILIDHLDDKIDLLENSDKNEKSAMINVQAVISSYAIELAMKSLCALDNPDNNVPHEHDLTKILEKLNTDTVKSLERLHLSHEELKRFPAPFVSNRYLMEYDKRDSRIVVYPPPLLRELTQMLEDKIKDAWRAILESGDVTFI